MEQRSAATVAVAIMPISHIFIPRYPAGGLRGRKRCSGLQVHIRFQRFSLLCNFDEFNK